MPWSAGGGIAPEDCCCCCCGGGCCCCDVGVSAVSRFVTGFEPKELQLREEPSWLTALPWIVPNVLPEPAHDAGNANAVAGEKGVEVEYRHVFSGSEPGTVLGDSSVLVTEVLCRWVARRGVMFSERRLANPPSRCTGAW